MTPNAEQKAAIESDAAVTVVAAGPGSGKSQTLVERVRARVAAGANPKRIVVLTFTNSAAHVFTERLKPLTVGFAGTLHGYCFRLIQAFGAEIGYRAGSVSIVTEQTQEALLLATAKRLGVKCSRKELFTRQENMPQANLVWDEYRHELKRSNMIDYDGILRDALRLLDHRNLVDELYVDEAQDSGDTDWQIYSAIGATSAAFFVGDPDQSIYAFRRGDPRIFVNMATDATNRLITLSLNYRSDIAICDAATRLIRHNSNRIDKPVISVSKGQGSVTVSEAVSDNAEIFLAYDAIRKSGYPFSNCAILCRTNVLVTKFKTMMRGFGVAVKRSGERRMPDDWSIALSAIGLLIDPGNEHHAERLLLAMGRKPHEIAALKLEALRQKTSLATVAIAILPNTSPATLGDALASLLMLGAGQESMELIRQRVAVLPNENPTLSDLLADLWNNKKWNEVDEGDGITVTTIHGAKGKEWDFVLVPACEERILPMWKPDGEQIYWRGPHMGEVVPNEGIEEERRLFFVAITRAKHQLVLTHAKTRTAFFKTTTQEPSRFLTEIK